MGRWERMEEREREREREREEGISGSLNCAQADTEPPDQLARSSLAPGLPGSPCDSHPLRPLIGRVTRCRPITPRRGNCRHPLHMRRFLPVSDADCRRAQHVMPYWSFSRFINWELRDTKEQAELGLLSTQQLLLPAKVYYVEATGLEVTSSTWAQPLRHGRKSRRSPSQLPLIMWAAITRESKNK
jgi:hypothetical protein